MEYYTEISPVLMVSEMAESLVGSEIIKIAAEIRKMKEAGEKVYNYTIGDFDPKLFPIPEEFKQEIIQAYQNDLTNYPPSNGMLELRQSISRLLHTRLGLEYKDDQILVSGGSRPLIYAAYQTIVDPDDTVVFPVPSWNNNHYTHLSRGKIISLETSPENNFMPGYLDIKPHISNTSLIALCSPLNPTGTKFGRTQLKEICELILEENSKRPDMQKPVYLIYDQVYWMLNYTSDMHLDPVNLYPEMKNYTIYIDGMSKAFASTGVRIGWATGPTKIIGKMKNILGHVGSWAPKPEQMAAAKFLKNDEAVSKYLENIKSKVYERLNGLYNSFIKLKEEGYPVDAIKPEASIYLTVKIDLNGKKVKEGETLKTALETTNYLLSHSGIAIVPFYAFGASSTSPWYRISVGQCHLEEIDSFFEALKEALNNIEVEE